MISSIRYFDQLIICLDKKSIRRQQCRGLFSAIFFCPYFIKFPGTYGRPSKKRSKEMGFNQINPMRSIQNPSGAYSGKGRRKMNRWRMFQRFLKNSSPGDLWHLYIKKKSNCTSSLARMSIAFTGLSNSPINCK